MVTTNSDHDGPIFANLAKHVSPTGGIVTLIKSRPNLLLVREAKPLKMKAVSEETDLSRRSWFRSVAG